MQYSLSSCSRSIPQITFPYPQDSITASLHILILGLVKPHSFTLPSIRLFEPSRVEVPIIPIKLDNQTDRGNKSINTKLSTNHMLRQVFNVQAVKDCVSNTFRLTLISSLLFCIHFYQACLVIRVGVSAFHRAVLRIIPRFTGWRNFIRLIAYFTSVFNLVSALPLISMFRATKVSGFTKSILRNVYLFAAYSTFFALSCFSLDTVVQNRTWLRAEKMYRLSLCNNLTALLASDASDWIIRCIHESIVPQVTAIRKPIALAVFCFEELGKENDVIYDPFLGSGITLIAAERLGRTVYGCELSPAYIDVIIRRWEQETGQTAQLVERKEQFPVTEAVAEVTKEGSEPR